MSREPPVNGVRQPDKVVLDLSAAAALFASFGLLAGFVLALHFWKFLGYKEKDRNEVGTIRRRVASTTLTCVLSAFLVCGLTAPAKAGEEGQRRGLTYAQLLGLESQDAPRACALCLALTAVLFTGPLAQHWMAYAEGFVKLVQRQNTWIAFRNLVVAPLTEEFVFRACVIRLWDAAALPAPVILVGAPLLFALGHAHHYVEHVRHHQDRRMALAQVAFQVGYTSVFGIYATFLLLRTGSAWAVAVAHAFCNHQGFPDFGFVRPQGHPLSPRRHTLATLYILGVVGFSLLLLPATEGFHLSYRCMREDVADDDF